MHVWPRGFGFLAAAAMKSNCLNTQLLCSSILATMPRHGICRYMVLWIVLSAAVILVNKYVLSLSGFPYPVALTCTHMLFCSTLAFIIVKMGWAEAAPLSAETYIK
jgi:hypothetical protein